MDLNSANSGGNSSSNSVRVPQMFGSGFATRMAFLTYKRISNFNLKIALKMQSDGGPRQYLWISMAASIWH